MLRATSAVSVRSGVLLGVTLDDAAVAEDAPASVTRADLVAGDVLDRDRAHRRTRT